MADDVSICSSFRIAISLCATGDFNYDGKDELVFYHRSELVTSYDVEGEYNQTPREKRCKPRQISN
ncbi:MAG: hypothetical protein AB2L24_32980 [Mangrovibacterium sp.]